MVVAQQVQGGVDHQIGQLPPVGMPVLLGLGRHVLHGDHHVPQRHQTRAGVRVLLIRQLAGDQVKDGKAQNVRGTVHLPHFKIDGVDARVAGDAHVHLTGEIHSLRRQSGADDLADESPLSLVDPRHVRRDGNIMPLCHSRLLHVSGPLRFTARVSVRPMSQSTETS